MMNLRLGEPDVNVLDRSVYKRLGGGYEGQRVRGTATVTLRIRHAGRFAVVCAVNELIAEGQKPRTLSFLIFLPPGTQEQVLRSLVDEMEETAKEAGADVRAGHVEVTAAVTRPVVTVVAESNETPEPPVRVRAGAEILSFGYVGMGGTVLLAQEKGEELTGKFSRHFMDQTMQLEGRLLLSPVQEMLSRFCREGLILKPLSLSAGGVLEGLWRLSAQTGLGLNVDLQAIPILQETVEITDYYGLNPYELESAGCLLAVTMMQESGEKQDPVSDRNGAVSDHLQKELGKQGLPVRRIGHLTNGREKLLINGDEKQCLNRPAADALIPLLG